MHASQEGDTSLQLRKDERTMKILFNIEGNLHIMQSIYFAQDFNLTHNMLNTSCLFHVPHRTNT